ncbi:MAG: class I SAM-dependent methyltransferase [Nostoc sp. EfeVER01]
MLEKARQNYPHIRFDVADASNFQVDKPLDAVFSNAVLHWVKEAIARSLPPQASLPSINS